MSNITLHNFDNVKRREPSSTNSNIIINKPRHISYSGKNILKTGEPVLKVGDKINACVYKIIESKFSNKPFLTFLLVNNNNILSFPSMTYQGKKPSVTMLNVLRNKIINANITYNGYLIENNLVTLSYSLQVTESYNPFNIFYNSKLWFVLVNEIVNWNKLMNFYIDTNVISFFCNNPHMMYLISNTGIIVETPIVGYHGDNSNKINLDITTGRTRNICNSAFGPYYYFGNYANAMRYAIWNNVSQCKNERGGIVRYAIFLGKHTMFLGRTCDNIIDTEICTSNTQLIANHFSKFRDSNGYWTENYDSILTPERVISISDSHTIIRSQYILKNFEQQFILSYHFVNTNQNVTKNTCDYAIIE